MTIFRLAVAISALVLPGAASADDYNRVVEIVNRTGEPIYYVHGSCRACDWENDMLGDDVIMPNARQRFDMEQNDGNCRYDFKVRTKSGREITRWNVNVCTEYTLVFGKS